MRCFTSDHLDHEFLLVDCFAEKIKEDLEDWLKIVNKFITDIDAPGSVLFGEKRIEIRPVVGEMKRKL